MKFSLSKNTICPECGEKTEPDNSLCPSCESTLLLKGKYRLCEVMGQSVGITYLAWDTVDSGPVIVKELSIQRIDDWKSEELFKRQGDVLRQLDHPQIPHYIDHFATGKGKKHTYYLVQEYIHGIDLRTEMKTKRYTEEEVIFILNDVLYILEYLHALNPPIIHRDIKPSNLMRKPDGTIALIDFGTVRDVLQRKGFGETIAGTFGYMAPEQFVGEAYVQSDLYSLGMVALVLLTRRPPEELYGPGMEFMWEDYISVSTHMKGIIHTFLQKHPENRPVSAKKARELYLNKNYNWALTKVEEYSTKLSPNTAKTGDSFLIEEDTENEEEISPAEHMNFYVQESNSSWLGDRFTGIIVAIIISIILVPIFFVLFAMLF